MSGDAGVALALGLRSDFGPRENNEDSVYGSADAVIVADGVGGRAAGEVASSTIVRKIAAALDTSHASLTSDYVKELLGVANGDLSLKVRYDPALAGMATTFTGLFIDGPLVRVFHIGDSRGYLLSNDDFHCVTRDDSFVQLLLDEGAITEEEAKAHPRRNVILKSLSGGEEDAEGITIIDMPARPGDRWLLASDGLTDYVPDAEIGRILASSPDRVAVADALVDAALPLTRDNVSVAVIDIVREEPGAQRMDPVFLGAAGAEEDRDEVARSIYAARAGRRREQ